MAAKRTDNNELSNTENDLAVRRVWEGKGIHMNVLIKVSTENERKGKEGKNGRRETKMGY